MAASRWRDGLAVHQFIRTLDGLTVGLAHRVMRTRIERGEAQIRKRIGSAAYRRLAMEGSQMSREAALRLALAPSLS